MVFIILGWVCTFLVLLGAFLNAKGYRKMAFAVWVCGDIGWIIYDYHIENWSHATLAAIIILMNVYGFKTEKNKKWLSTVRES